MNAIAGHPEKTFIVGQVRVALWKNEDDTLSLTVERNRPDILNKPNWTPLLDQADTTKAILALKKVHDYLQSSEALDWDEQEAASHVQAPERIP